MAAAKIDLKARLGRKTAAAAAPQAAAPVAQAAPAASPSVPPASHPAGTFGSVPPQAAAPQQPVPQAQAASAFGGAQAGPAFGSQPAPAARSGLPQPAGFGGAPRQPAPQGPGGISIPAPPGFGAKPAQPAAQKAAPAQPQLAIKMEMGEEVVQAQRAARKKTLVLAAATALVGLGIGYGIGQLVKGNEGAQAAVQGAELLVKEIDAANTELLKLEEILQNAGTKLQNGEYPSKEIEELGAVDIPFDGSNLTNKGIGRYNQTAVSMLIQYSNAVAEVEDQKDKIRRLFGATKEAFLAEAEEKKSPKVHWGITVKGGPDGPWGQMTLVKPFEVKGKDNKAKWPDSLEFGKSKAERYTKGDLTKSDGEIIPVDPETERAVCPESLSIKLMGALVDLREDLKGDDTPGRERPSVVDLGDKVLDQLRKIGGPG